MPLTLPDLDDRSFTDLVAEARALIPALAPDWTDHNPSDPGITLIELFAWLAEMLLYRINQVTDRNRIAFLRLINGPDWKPDPKKNVAEEIRGTVVKLRMPERAVTAADFERLASSIPGVARAHCVPRRNLEDHAADMPADVSVVVVLKPTPEPAAHVLDWVLDRVRQLLDRARLLTTRVHIVAARPVPIGFDLKISDRAHAASVYWRRDPPRAAITLTFTIHARPDMPGDQLLEAAEQELRRFFSPYEGGPGGLGWPFGRPVYLTEIWERLARVPGVDYVTAIEQASPAELWRRLPNTGRELEGIALEPDELPQALISTGKANLHTPEEPSRD